MYSCTMYVQDYGVTTYTSSNLVLQRRAMSSTSTKEIKLQEYTSGSKFRKRKEAPSKKGLAQARLCQMGRRVEGNLLSTQTLQLHSTEDGVSIITEKFNHFTYIQQPSSIRENKDHVGSIKRSDPLRAGLGADTTSAVDPESVFSITSLGSAMVDFPFEFFSTADSDVPEDLKYTQFIGD